MDRPNRITNRNIGTQVVTGTFSGKPNAWRSQPSWVMATSTPYAAQIDSRFITAALTAIVTERNITVSSTIETRTTTAISHGSRWPTRLENATPPAFGPVRYARMPVPAVARGITWSFRRFTSALVAVSCSPVVG